MKTPAKGQVLPIVMVSLLVLSIVIYGMVSWIQNESRWSVKQQKNSTALNLAQAAVDRGTWKLQSTTTTWIAAANGATIPGYNFDVTYYDVPGGSYRIQFAAGPQVSEVTLTAEGRDNSTNEVRAVSAVYKNQTIYSAMMSGGNISWAQGLGVYWGPIIAQGNITLMDDNVARRYFPRKYAKGIVTTGAAVSAAYQNRDLNGLAPPNTDNTEWWSAYAGVPNVPVLDFAAMRSSAAASGTLNVYGCGCAAVPQYTINGTTVATAWDTGRSAATCVSDGDAPASAHTFHFGNSTNFYAARGLSSTQDYVWYWDHDVTLEGDGYNGSLATSLRGTVVVRGALTINSSGDMMYTGKVPSTAWQEEQKLLVNTYDSTAASEYPADIGYHVSTGVWHFGTDSWNEPGIGGPPWINTVGIKGFVYVGGDLNITSFLDINGAVWVNGSIVSAYNNPTQFCGVLYDDALNVPALNVILFRQSWQEVAASPTVWAP